MMVVARMFDRRAAWKEHTMRWPVGMAVGVIVLPRGRLMGW